MNRKLVINVGHSNVYNLLIVLLPLFGYLRSPLSFMNLGIFFLLIMSPFIIMRNVGHANKTVGIRPLLPYLICIILQSLIFFLWFNDNKGIVPSLYMCFICIITLCFGMRRSFDLDKARTLLETVGIVLTFAVLFQYILFFLTGVARPLLPQTLLYDQESFSTEILYIGSIPRFGGFFPEPAHFAQYNIICLISSLFPKESDTGNIKRAMLLTLGILLTTSGMGLALGAFVWMTWYVFYKREKSSNRFVNILFNVVVVIIAALLLFALAMQFDAFQLVVDRIFGIHNSSYNAIQGRSWAYNMYQRLDRNSQIYGVGYGFVPPIFMASVPLTLYTTGIFGLITLVYSLVYLILKSKGFSREVCVVFALMLLFTGVFNQRGVAFYYSFMIAGAMVKKNKQDYTL